jgi:dTDP-4-dehydrorhamnose reductase
MKVLVFGKTGQVAQELARDPRTLCLSRAEADLTNPDACAQAILHANPDAVINAAAYTAVDRAESEEELATTINGHAPGAMARACARAGIPFVHLSTDYVFDGSGNIAHSRNTPPAPINAYGRSKRLGEIEILASRARAIILRTSWVFSPHGVNFVKTMLRLSQSHASLKIVDDQIGGPTPADSIAAACLQMASASNLPPAAYGIHHFAGAPDVSWAIFAREIFSQSNRTTDVIPIPSTDFPTAAARPQNSRLECASLAALGLRRPDWKAGLARTLSSLERLSS